MAPQGKETWLRGMGHYVVVDTYIRKDTAKLNVPQGAFQLDTRSHLAELQHLGMGMGTRRLREVALVLLYMKSREPLR